MKELFNGKTATPSPQPKQPKKGLYNGNYNRTACQLPGATWYNHSTMAYYCPMCAGAINSANHSDAMRLFGHELCTEGKLIDK